MPGSPVKIKSELAMIPPPRTRSHSSISERIRFCGLLSICASFVSEGMAVDFLFVPEKIAGLISCNVSHWLQLGQHPIHFGVL